MHLERSTILGGFGAELVGETESSPAAGGDWPAAVGEDAGVLPAALSAA